MRIEKDLSEVTKQPTSTRKRRSTSLSLMVALSLVLACSGPMTSSEIAPPVSIDSIRNSTIATRIADEQPDQIAGFFKEYVASVKLDNVLVMSNPVKMERLSSSVFSQESSMPMGTFSSYYNGDGVLLSLELVTDRTKVNLPEINQNIDDVIAKDGSDSPKLADLYEEILRQRFNLPPDTFCSPRIEHIGIPEQSILSMSCTERHGGWDFAAFMRTDGSILVDKSDPVANGSCGIGY